MYSAYIEGNSHVFQIPVQAAGANGDNVEWTASAPSMVQIDPGAIAGYALITMLKAGDTTITANANMRCGVSTLHITAATEEQWQMGNARYNDMNPLPRIPTDGGVPIGPMNYVLDPPGMPPACTNCHGETATSNVLRATTPTPAQTGGFSDQQLIAIFTQGAVPMDCSIDPLIPDFVWSFLHRWTDITGDAQQSMVVYLRSLVTRPGSSMINMGPSECD
jgi:hypothetical protein